MAKTKTKSVVAEIPAPAKKLPLAVVVANQKKVNAIRAAKIKNGEYKDVIAAQLKAEQNGETEN